MKNLILFALCLFLSSCGATGRLVGTVARLPVDIVRSGTGMYQEGTPAPEIDAFEASALNQTH